MMDLLDTLFIPLAVGLLACCAMCVYRIGRGPTAPDRTVAIDVLGTVVVGFVGILSAATGKDYLLNVAIVWGLISFVGTLALAKHLLGRAMNE